MSTCLYTKEELITSIKAIDLKLNGGISGSSLDTNQGKQSFSKQISEMTKQRNWYYRMLCQFYPGNFNGIVNLSTNRRGY